MTVSFRAKLLASHAAIALAVGAVTLFMVERSISSRMESQVDRRLEAQARAVANWMQRAKHPDRLAGRLAGVVGARVTILDAAGRAVGESQNDGAPGVDPGAPPPEVRAAREGRVGRATRTSKVTGELVRYVAVAGPRDLVIRLGLDIGEIDETKAELRNQLGVAALVSLVIALFLAALVAGPLTRRLRDATALARRIGHGDYDMPPARPSRDEVGVLTNSLTAAAAELRDAEMQRRAFLATVAHEIRTPITSIRGYAQTLATASVSDSDREEFLLTIERNAERVGQLVEDLLELEALQSEHGRELASDSVAVAPVVRHVIDTLRGRASELDATVDSDIDPDLTVLGDSDAIERILLNLADNALRHGGRGVAVAIRGQRAGGRALLVVTDNGPGIADDQHQRIFERFYRGVGDRRGSGLGLAIARELARKMKGTLSVSSSPAKGAEFTLELPS